MASKTFTTVPHSLIKALGQAIGTHGFQDEDAVLRQFATTCSATLRKRLIAFSVACRRAHDLSLDFRAAH